MKYVLILLLLFTTQSLHSQSRVGRVAFDAPTLTSPEFRFDLDKRVIALVLADPNSNIAPLFGHIDTLRLRSYQKGAANIEAVVRHYDETLKARGWKKVADPKVHLYTAHRDERVNGVFITVQSGAQLYLINIVGDIPETQLGTLLTNLQQIGIEIPELMSLKPEHLKPDVQQEDSDPPQPPSGTEAVPLPSTTAEAGGEPETAHRWSFDDRVLQDIHVEGGSAVEAARVMKVLENGTGDIINLMPILAIMLRKHSKKVSLRVEEKGSEYRAILTLSDTPATVKVLKTLTIREGYQRSNYHQVVIEEEEPQTPVTRFRAGDMPISELRIRGAQKVSETQIHQVLENGSENIHQALNTLFKALPYFKELQLEVHAEDARYIATVTVVERPLSSDIYLGFKPPIRLGFNRVTGWEIGSGVEGGKRKDLGQLWTWNVQDSVSEQTANLFGAASYALGNRQLHYRLGGRANWGTPYSWKLGLTAHLHRLTDTVAPEMFPHYSNPIFTFQRVIGVPDIRNYYLREGAEIAIQWAPVLPTHAFKLTLVRESHASLEKSTDWFVANWRSNFHVRENPAITEGQMRSLTFQYDFRQNRNPLGSNLWIWNDRRLFGWHNTLLVERSLPSIGSDFDFTRVQVHLRYAFPLQNNAIRTRFVFGTATGTLPVQRQFVISGIDGLRGYEQNASDGGIGYAGGHLSSPYAFAGDSGFLLNIEYHYRLSNLSSRDLFRNAALVLFFDEGQVWNASDPEWTFDPKGDIGIGLQFGEHTSIFRVNIAKAFEAERGFQITTVWAHSF